MKKFWIIVLVASTLWFLALCLAPLEAYTGIDAPFVTISENTFRIFGKDFEGDAQLGILLICGVLMMVPARAIPLAIAKLWQS
jgi:hypothetical protein